MGHDRGLAARPRVRYTLRVERRRPLLLACRLTHVGSLSLAARRPDRNLLQAQSSALATSRSPAAYHLRITFLSNLPTEVRGTASMKVQASGSCHFATDSARKSRSSAGFTVAPSRSTTDASGRSCHFSSGIPTTAASRTSGCAIRAFSRSTDEIHSPPDLITSLDRSVSVMYPSG